MTRWLAQALAVLTLASGCSISEIGMEQGDERTVNRCASASECGGGVCVSGACQGRQGQFETLLFEVLPSGGTEARAAGRTLITTTALPLGGGALTLDVLPASRLEGQVSLAEDSDCVPSVTTDGKLAVSVTLTPSEQVLGLEPKTFTAVTPLDAQGHALQPFSLRVAPGDYDIYVQAAPDAAVDPRCLVGPQLYRHQHLGSGNFKLDLQVPPPTVLAVKIARSVSSTLSLDGWSLDLVDASSGRVIAVPTTLGSPGIAGYEARLRYLPVIGGAAARGGTGSELVRLSPPPGVTAPTLVWERAALELFELGEARIDDLELPAKPVSFEARVVDERGNPVEGASVSLVATELLDVMPGLIASFTLKNRLTDADGLIKEALLPGTYRVFASPPSSSGLATLESSWSVSTAPVQAGQELVLRPRSSLSGAVVVGWGPGELLGVGVHAVPVPLESSSPELDRLLGRRPFMPRASTAVLQLDGSFSVPVDPASYHLSVRGESEAGFPWLVRPYVSVDGSHAEEPLGQLELPLPIVYELSLSDGDVPLAGALVRAYIFTDVERRYTPDPSAARSVVQIAETRVDGGGRGRLLVPALLD